MLNERTYGFTVTSEGIADVFEAVTGRMPTDNQLNQIMDKLDNRLGRYPYKYGYTDYDLYDLLQDICYEYVRL